MPRASNAPGRDWWLDAVAVHTATATGTVVTLGDSITDGACTGVDAHQRWTDVLATAMVGVPLGLLIGRFRVLEAAIGIYVTAGFAMPLVALVPLLVLWLGLGFAVKVAIIFLMSVFPICINTWLGVAAVPKTLIEVGKSFVAPDRVILRRIILPATLPYIMAGVRLAVGRAVVAMVIAEFFTSISGLGAIIQTSANNFDTATTFVPIVIIMLMAVSLNFFVGAIERWVAPWQAEIAGRDQQ